jgi:N-acyl-D-amino-acid deacylase
MKLVKDALVVDGGGGEGRMGSIIVENDRIKEIVYGSAAVNGISESAFDETVDASGALATPGFIDCHAHSDAYLILEPSAPSKITQGITTEINGQCGGSAAPRYGEARLSSDWAALLGEKLVWRSLAEYRDAFSAANPAVNTVQFIGHNTLRSSVVGYAGREATPDELKAMENLLAKSLDEGGFGLTTGLIYQPGRYSTPAEVEALARTAAAKGGFYATHMRSEGDEIESAIDEVVKLAEKTGIRAEISHLKTSGRRNWHKIDEVVEKVGRAVERGVLIGADRYPFCAAGTDLDVVLPDWAQEGAAPAEMERFADPEKRAAIIAEIDASSRDWSTVMIGGTWHEDGRKFSGRTVADCAGSSPGRFIVDLLERDGCKTGAFFFGMSEDNLAKILAQPWTVPGSDASLRAPWGPLGEDHPHPRAYSTMPEFYRRLRMIGASRGEAVRRMTALPAERFGLKGRGVLEKGAFADIAVWDEDNFRGTASYVQPHRFASGMRTVMVNGIISFCDGVFTGARGGRFLERG